LILFVFYLMNYLKGQFCTVKHANYVHYFSCLYKTGHNMGEYPTPNLSV